MFYQYHWSQMTLMNNYCQHQKTLRELVERYKQKKISFDKQHETLDNEKEDDSFIGTSIFDHLACNIFIFVMAKISAIHIVYSNKTYLKERKCKHW